MNQDTRERLKEQAESIKQFMELEKGEQDWLYPLLSRGIRSTIELLDLISDHRLSYQEIATELGMNAQTVTQKLHALAEGGLPIDLTEKGAFALIGRPRTLARKP